MLVLHAELGITLTRMFNKTAGGIMVQSTAGSTRFVEGEFRFNQEIKRILKRIDNSSIEGETGIQRRRRIRRQCNQFLTLAPLLLPLT